MLLTGGGPGQRSLDRDEPQGGGPACGGRAVRPGQHASQGGGVYEFVPEPAEKAIITSWIKHWRPWKVRPDSDYVCIRLSGDEIGRIHK